jgi:hypothetical protein
VMVFGSVGSVIHLERVGVRFVKFNGQPYDLGRFRP